MTSSSGTAAPSSPGALELELAQTLVYEPLGWERSDLTPEPESAEYGACTLTLAGRSVAFRVAKTTPTKVGQFVTLWRRSEAGPIRPLDVSDGVDLVVVACAGAGRQGQLVFPTDVLVRRSVVSAHGSDGKRALRVYPPWVTPASAQARRTQQWQTEWFLPLDPARPADLDLARRLYGT